MSASSGLDGNLYVQGKDFVWLAEGLVNSALYTDEKLLFKNYYVYRLSLDTLESFLLFLKMYREFWPNCKQTCFNAQEFAFDLFVGQKFPNNFHTYRKTSNCGAPLIEVHLQ
jgi:hypothetical protein